MVPNDESMININESKNEITYSVIKIKVLVCEIKK